MPVTVQKENAVISEKPKMIILKREHKKENTQKLKLLKLNKTEKHLINIREILKSTNATPIQKYIGMGYNCCYCKDQFPEAGTLKKHTIDTHKDLTQADFMKVRFDSYVVKLDITNLICKLCNESINTLEQVMEHLKEQHNKKIFKEIPNHILPFKFNSDSIKCFMCLNIFNTFKALMEHMHVHYRNYICEICDAGFVNKTGLGHHKTIHEKGSYKCQYCPKVFKNSRSKKGHERSVHVLARYVHKCPYCTEKFTNIQFKYNHMKEIHGTKATTFKCKACDKTFNNSAQFRRHTKRDHLLERPHKCTECEKSFFTKKNLTNHLVVHTGSREFQCDVCSKCYGRKKTLREHMKIHNDEKRFKCDLCGLAFIQKCSMKAHIKSKHGESSK